MSQRTINVRMLIAAFVLLAAIIVGGYGDVINAGYGVHYWNGIFPVSNMSMGNIWTVRVLLFGLGLYYFVTSEMAYWKERKAAQAPSV